MNFRDFIDIFALEPTKPNNYREQLYITGTVFPLLFNQLMEKIRNDNNLTYAQIADHIGISDKQFRAWRNGSSPIPISALKTLSKSNQRLRDKLEHDISYISSSRGVSISIPRNFSPEMIEIFGRFCGDGSCGAYDGDYKWSLKEEGKNLLYINYDDMKNVFQIEGKVIDYGSFAEYLVRSKPLVLLFQQIFRYHSGFKKTYDIEAPDFLQILDWNLRKYFTTGLIDTEGSFYYTNQSYYFEIHMVNRSLLNEVSYAFDQFGIPYNYKKGNRNDFKIISYNKLNCELIADTFDIKNEKHLNKLRSWGFY